MRNSTVRTSAILGVLLAATAFGCGNSEPPPLLDVDIFGWEAGSGFIPSLPTMNDAQTMRLKVTRPATGEVLLSDTTPVAMRSLSLEEIPYGEGLRIELEVLNSVADIIGTGATPIFSMDRDGGRTTLRVQVTPVNSFAPVGNIVSDRNTGERKFAPSQFDYRGKPGDWQGRVGHSAAMTSSGQVLVVGGGDPAVAYDPTSLGTFRTLFADVQLFDPQTGYFADLAYDEAAKAILSDDRDTLFEPIVHHTVTAIGNDRYLVAGGFVLRSGVLRPSNTLQIIDLNQAPGARVTRLTDASGSSLVLQKARAMHTATYRAADNHVIIAGGIGPESADDVLGTYELVDLTALTVSAQPLNLVAPRAQHRAVSMSNGDVVWLVGGRGATNVLATTETIQRSATGTEASAEGTMRRPRLLPAVTTRNSPAGELLFVAGGFTDFDGTVDNTYEVSRVGRNAFDGGTSWTLPSARGGAIAVTLPNSNNIVVVGGRGENNDLVAKADILTLNDLTANPPFTNVQSDAWGNARLGSTVTPMTNGRLLLVGGEGYMNGSLVGFDTADIFNPLDPILSPVILQ